jgi:hypothetical protein
LVRVEAHGRDERLAQREADPDLDAGEFALSAFTASFALKRI